MGPERSLAVPATISRFRSRWRRRGRKASSGGRNPEFPEPFRDRSAMRILAGDLTTVPGRRKGVAPVYEKE